MHFVSFLIDRAAGVPSVPPARLGLRVTWACTDKDRTKQQQQQRSKLKQSCLQLLHGKAVVVTLSLGVCRCRINLLWPVFVGLQDGRLRLVGRVRTSRAQKRPTLKYQTASVTEIRDPHAGTREEPVDAGDLFPTSAFLSLLRASALLQPRPWTAGADWASAAAQRCNGRFGFGSGNVAHVLHSHTRDMQVGPVHVACDFIPSTDYQPSRRSCLLPPRRRMYVDTDKHLKVDRRAWKRKEFDCRTKHSIDRSIDRQKQVSVVEMSQLALLSVAGTGRESPELHLDQSAPVTATPPRLCEINQIDKLAECIGH
uniref:Uncharacterized protein n=1 Tax=Peronospora matthiolae TaxID=2874970 RepID=A0AAV1T3A9_9STRA